MSLQDGFLPVEYRNGRWKAAGVEDIRIMRQLRSEAKVPSQWPDDREEVYDRLLSAATHHGFGLQTEETE